MKTKIEYSPLSGASNVLITGSTGLIGGELLRRLLLKTEDKKGKLWTLVRADDQEHAKRRIEERLKRSAVGETELKERSIRALVGDVTKPSWNMPDNIQEALFKDLDIIIHCASDTSFLYSQSIYDGNVAGVKNLIEMVKASGKSPLIVYISTAANVGNVKNEVVTEERYGSEEIDHHNFYTRSKADSEKLLIESGLPALIFRPSIVLSAGIEDSDFASSILWMIPLIYHFDALPIRKDSRIDVVPVDFVCDAILKLLSRGSLRHQTYHISAGSDYATSVEEAFGIADLFYGKEKIILLSPESWTKDSRRLYVNNKKRRELYHRIRYYFPFLNMNVIYDNKRLKEELPDMLPERLKNYMPNLLAQFDTNRALEESVKP